MKKLFLTVSLAAVLTIGVGASGGDFGTDAQADVTVFDSIGIQSKADGKL
ncbi:hypothetical protein ACE1TF_13760 [Geomicrobium sp. JSM 1781026]|nr:hypothetical protein [Geomicrobium sp. JCM 19037]